MDVNSAPTPGLFSVSPSSGTIVSMTDSVLFSAASFEDAATDLPLYYQFEYEKDGKGIVLRPFSEATTFSTRYLPVGALLPILLVKDVHGSERRVLLGCSNFKDSAVQKPIRVLV